jgi:hypothetical protein
MGREPCSGFETTVADRIEAVMPEVGITPGARECHDALPDRHRVDWIYQDARPRPFALEVTSIVAAVDRRGDSAIMALGRRLTALAEEEELGAWIIALQNDRSVRAMEPDVVKILRDAQPIRERLLADDGSIRPGYYTGEDLLRRPRDVWSAYIAEHGRLRELGIVDLKPIQSEKRNVVYVLPTRGGTVGSFTAELLERLQEKREVLGLEANLERHLGVLVERWDRSNEPEDTPVPEIPAEIDVLWIVHAWRQAFDTYPVWVARRGESAWSVYTASSSGSTSTSRSTSPSGP